MSFITGQFKKKLYEDKRSNFNLYLFEMEEKTIKVIYQGLKAPSEGTNWFSIHGSWKQHPHYGMQFYISRYELSYSFKQRNQARIQQILDLVAPA